MQTLTKTRIGNYLRRHLLGDQPTFRQGFKEGIAFARKYTTPQPQRDTWKNAAIRLGEELSSFGPDGYYDMTAEQWLSWALDQQPNGKHSLPQPQRPWVGLTPADFDWLEQVFANKVSNDFVFADIVCVISAKLKEKNT